MDFFVLNFLVSIDEKNAHGNSLYNLALDISKTFVALGILSQRM